MACGRLLHVTTSSCRRPVTATSSGATKSYKSNVIDNGQATNVKYRLRCWYLTVETSGPQDKSSWNHTCRWATDEADRRIRNMIGQSQSKVSKVHNKDERKEHVFETSQTDNKYAIQEDDYQNSKLSLNRQKQTRSAQSDYVFQSRTPVRQGRKFKKVHVKKLKTLTSVYMNKSDKKQRHERLLNKIEEIQISDAKLKHAQTIQKQEEHKISRKRQVDSLREVRQRFDQEQAARFQTQFVSWKSVEKYRYKTSNNGLPDVLPTFHSKEKATDHRPLFCPIEKEKLRTRNKKRYKTILDPSINNIRVKTSVKRSHETYTHDRRNTLVVEDAQQVLINTELEMFQLDDVSE